MTNETIAKTLDASGLQCPMPVIKTRKSINQIEVGEVLEVISTDPGSLKDMESWARQTKHELLESTTDSGKYRFLFKRCH